MSDVSQEKCKHPDWYQEGEGEGAIRCCRSCGFIAICRDSSKPHSEIDLSVEEASEIRKRAGISKDIVNLLAASSVDNDMNQQLLRARKERTLYGTCAIMYVLFVGLFYKWILEPCKTKQQVIGGIVFLGALFIFIFYRAVRAHFRISNIEASISQMNRP
jgi:hypothetical protein